MCFGYYYIQPCLLLTRKNPYHRGLSDQRAAQLTGMPIAPQFSNDYTGVQGAILDGAQYPSALASATAS